MNNYPCKDCVLCGNCSKICGDILINGNVTLNLFEFIIAERCCVDCGCKDGEWFIRHFLYIVCNRCNSIYIVSASNKDYEISRHFKYDNTVLPDIKWTPITFEEFLNDLFSKKIGENHELPL